MTQVICRPRGLRLSLNMNFACGTILVKMLLPALGACLIHDMEGRSALSLFPAVRRKKRSVHCVYLLTVPEQHFKLSSGYGLEC